MKWIKAKDDKPQDQLLYCLKFYKLHFSEPVPCKAVGRYFDGKWIINNYPDETVIDLEWLDESPTPAPVEVEQKSAEEVNEIMLAALKKVYGLIKQCGIQEDMDCEEHDYLLEAINAGQ